MKHAGYKSEADETEFVVATGKAEGFFPLLNSKVKAALIRGNKCFE